MAIGSGWGALTIERPADGACGMTGSIRGPDDQRIAAPVSTARWTTGGLPGWATGRVALAAVS